MIINIKLTNGSYSLRIQIFSASTNRYDLIFEPMAMVFLLAVPLVFRHSLQLFFLLHLIKDSHYVALVPLNVCWQPCKSVILVLVADFLPYRIVAIVVVDKIAYDRGTNQGFLYHVLPHAVTHGLEFLTVLVEKTGSNFLVFLVWRNKRMTELVYENLVNLTVAEIPWCAVFLSPYSITAIFSGRFPGTVRSMEKLPPPLFSPTMMPKSAVASFLKKLPNQSRST